MSTIKFPFAFLTFLKPISGSTDGIGIVSPEYKPSFNAANELAVRQFLNREIKYLEIVEIIEDCMRAHQNIANPSVEQILDTEAATYDRINSRR